MLKLNFMPEKKRAIKLEPEFFYWAAEFLAILVVLLIIGGIITGNVNRLVQERDQKKKEVQSNTMLLRKIKELEASKKDLERKKAIIDRLDTNRQKWVKILDKLLDLLPDQVWFNKFSGNGNKIEITGTALTILYLNEFIKSLEQSGMFSNIDLQNINSGVSRKINQPIFKFSLTLTINPNWVGKEN